MLMQRLFQCNSFLFFLFFDRGFRYDQIFIMEKFHIISYKVSHTIARRNFKNKIC